MLLELTNTPRDYAWGSTTAIAEFLGTAPTGQPEAELWLGTHPGSPARTPRAVTDHGEEHATLADWISAHPELLGDPLAAAGDLPILLKVLAAAAPLSLQVHPTPEQARAGFAAEQARGIPVDDPARNYRDPFPKPEIIVAVSETFDALCGFRPAPEVGALIADLAAAGIAAPLRAVLEDPTRIADALDWLLSGAPEVQATVAEIIAYAQTPDAADAVSAATFATAREIAAHNPGDPGVVVAMLMNRVRLRRGECLFTPAGLLHAYLDGLGIELMTASDNVVRGGLTPKHIDTAELRALLSFEQRAAAPLEPAQVAEGVLRYAPPAPWRLDLVDPRDGDVAVPLGGPSILLVEGASVRVAADDAELALPRGGAAFADAGTESLTVSGPGRLWIATALPA